MLARLLTVAAAVAIVAVVPAALIGWLLFAACYMIGAVRCWADQRELSRTDPAFAKRDPEILFIGALLWPILYAVDCYDRRVWQSGGQEAHAATPPTASITVSMSAPGSEPSAHIPL